MRTTLDLPEALLKAAVTATGRKSKTETIVYALEEVVRRKKIDALKAMLGTVSITTDLAKTRGRRRAAIG